MFIKIQNENYGYAVATYGDYVVVSNPAILRYDAAVSQSLRTGSLDYFRYNKSTDEHDFINTLHKTPIEMDILLTTEAAGTISSSAPLHTETSSISTSDKDLAIDKDKYTSSLEDGFGVSLDMYNKNLVVGCPYFTQVVQTNQTIITASGGAVEVHDLGLTEYLASSASTLIYTIDDPDVLLTSSFGAGVSINRDWIAIGSPEVSGSNGAVYMYLNQTTGSQYTWSLAQKIEATGIIAGARFGTDLKLNKITGSARSASLIVGCGNPINAKAYFFELRDGVWTQTYVFLPDYSIQPLTFADYQPYDPTMNLTNGFGSAVSVYGDAAIIGEFGDRAVYEYSGSAQFLQGSVYIFERCPTTQTLFQQVFKTYGNVNILKNNLLGFSVDIFDGNAVAGVPKINNTAGTSGADETTLTSCYIGGTLEQLHQCNSDLENVLDGQAMLIQKNTSSGDWGITNIYQKKKKFLSPYRSFGFDVSIADKSMVVGAPIYLSDSNREINISITQSNNVTLDDVTGKGYIYNLKNLRDTFHIGNVFYRNGKIVIMTSGSVFDGLFFNPVNTSDYEYDLQFKGQHTILEKQVVCSVNPGEFNVSTNPSAVITPTATLDINGNGRFDFQDVDIILRYMQYKNTSLLGVPVTTDWSSSVVKTDDEISLLNYYQASITDTDTATRTSASLIEWETTNTGMQIIFDLNEDNRIDIRDMNIMWKYFANRLTQANYALYITPSCHRTLFSDVMDYLNGLSQKQAKPLIDPQFFDYEHSVATDKTGSFLAPYATTIGLYSGLDLVAVAKLGNPIKITPELPINFVVKMDF